MDIGQALGSAWNRTLYLLGERGSLRRWLALGLLAALSGGGGGGGFQVPSGMGDHDPAGLHIPVEAIIAVVLLAIGVGAFFFWLGCIARFVFLENLIYDRHSILEPARRLMGLGTRLFGFGLAVASVGLASLLAMGAVLFGISSVSSELSVMAAAASLLLIVIPAFLLLIIAFTIADEFMVPIMYRDNCSASSAFSQVWQLMFRNKLAFFWWMMARFMIGGAWALLIVCAIVALVAFDAIIVGLVAVPAYFGLHLDVREPGGILLIVGAVLSVIALLVPQALLIASPGPVLCRSFSIYLLQQIDPATVMLPLNGRHTVYDVVREVEEPGFSSASRAALPESSSHEEGDWVHE